MPTDLNCGVEEMDLSVNDNRRQPYVVDGRRAPPAQFIALVGQLFQDKPCGAGLDMVFFWNPRAFVEDSLGYPLQAFTPVRFSVLYMPSLPARISDQSEVAGYSLPFYIPNRQAL